MKKTRLIPTVAGLESRAPLAGVTGVPAPAIDASEWVAGTGVTGDWEPDTLDQYFNQAASGVADEGFDEWGSGTAGTGDWGSDASEWDDAVGVSGDWSP